MARDLARDGRGGPGPRQGALSWDDYFMSVAFLTAMRSKDPSTQVGACIVNDRNRIIGVGYNGMPGGCPNDQLPWSKRSPEGELATKYPYVVHAELNAVLNKNAESCSGCRIYSTLFPCNECAKVIIQAGIKQVIFASDKHNDRASAKASRRLFELANVQLRQHVPEAELLQLPLRYTEEARGSVAAADAPAPLAVAACDCSRHTQHSQHWHATGHATGWHAGGHAVGAFAASASAALFAGVLARRRGTGMPGMPGLLRALRALRV